MAKERDRRLTRESPSQPAASRSKAATRGDLDALRKGMLDATAVCIKEYVAKEVGYLRSQVMGIQERLDKEPVSDLKSWFDCLVERIEALEARLDRAEQKGLGVRYLGVWQKAQKYDRGDLATYNGSVWHCNATTRSMPGVDSDWQLAVKAGRDAR